VNYDPIILAMMAAFEMIDHASDAERDPDFAVDVQQTMGSYLNELAPDDVREFREALRRISREQLSGHAAFAEYIQDVANRYAPEND
jgi:hypothetical protein